MTKTKTIQHEYGESEICEVNECKNPVQLTVSQNGASKQRRVCNQCVLFAMLIMGAEE